MSKKDKFSRIFIVLLKGVILTACTLSFWPYLVAAGIKGQTGDYSHVFVIPIIALVVYLRSECKEPSTVRPWVAGGLLGLGILLRMLGEWQSSPLLAEASFPLLFLGFTELLFGHGEMRRMIFPAIFLLFAFGFVTDILLALFAKYLMLVSAGAAYDAVTTFIPGYGPYIINGNMIIVPPNIQFNVIEACSGIRGMLSVFVIGSLLGYTKKLTGRQWIRFLFLLSVLSISINLIRIATTIVFSLILQGHFSHQTVHDTINWVVFGPLILLIPLVVGRAQKSCIRISLISTIAIILLVVHAVQWHVRAAQGNTQVVISEMHDDNSHVTLKIDQQSLPKAFAPYVSPEVNGRRYWYWIITSGFVHSNILHLLTNVGILLLLGYAIRSDLRWPWMLVTLLAGQITGSITGWLNLPSGTQNVVFTGASCAISALFGAYLILHLLARHKWMQTIIFLFIYLAGLWANGYHIGSGRYFSSVAHITGLITGVIIAILYYFILMQSNDSAKKSPKT